jgi:hypothetical protein
MNAGRADRYRQVWVGCDQHGQLTAVGDVGEAARGLGAVGGAEVTVDQTGAGGQTTRYRERVGRSDRVGQEDERRNGRGADVAVEPLSDGH